ncbi:UNVERIFIED_CONTAM: hypothetical protein K2H54_054228 [Gekko kuhli]
MSDRKDSAEVALLSLEQDWKVWILVSQAEQISFPSPAGGREGGPECSEAGEAGRGGGVAPLKREAHTTTHHRPLRSLGAGRWAGSPFSLFQKALLCWHGWVDTRPHLGRV